MSEARVKKNDDGLENEKERVLALSLALSNRNNYPCSITCRDTVKLEGGQFDPLDHDQCVVYHHSADRFDTKTSAKTVICLKKDLEIKGDVDLFLPDKPVIFNIEGTLKVNGGKLTASRPQDVLFHLQGEGADVAFSGGGGGNGCCKAWLDGTILAPERKVRLSPGRVTGQIFSEKDITLSSGSIVECPEPKPTPKPTPKPNGKRSLAERPRI